MSIALSDLPCPCHAIVHAIEKPLRFPYHPGKMPIVRAQLDAPRLDLAAPLARANNTKEHAWRGAPNVSPAPHLHALTCHHIQRALTRRLHSPASRSSHGLERETSSCLPSEGVPGSHQAGAEQPVHRPPAGPSQSAAHSASQSVSQVTSCRPVHPSQNHKRQSVGRIDRLLSTTSRADQRPSPS